MWDHIFREERCANKGISAADSGAQFVRPFVKSNKNDYRAVYMYRNTI